MLKCLLGIENKLQIWLKTKYHCNAQTEYDI
jgi:DNA-binding transcriptional regulator/RsmH inhibitor MraZ